MAVWNWPADSAEYTSITSMVNAAASGDTILIAAGTHYIDQIENRGATDTSFHDNAHIFCPQSIVVAFGTTNAGNLYPGSLGNFKAGEITIAGSGKDVTVLTNQNRYQLGNIWCVESNASTFQDALENQVDMTGDNGNWTCAPIFWITSASTEMIDFPYWGNGSNGWDYYNLVGGMGGSNKKIMSSSNDDITTMTGCKLTIKDMTINDTRHYWSTGPLYAWWYNGALRLENIKVTNSYSGLGAFRFEGCWRSLALGNNPIEWYGALDYGFGQTDSSYDTSLIVRNVDFVGNTASLMAAYSYEQVPSADLYNVPSRSGFSGAGGIFKVQKNTGGLFADKYHDYSEKVLHEVGLDYLFRDRGYGFMLWDGCSIADNFAIGCGSGIGWYLEGPPLQAEGTPGVQIINTIYRDNVNGDYLQTYQDTISPYDGSGTRPYCEEHNNSFLFASTPHFFSGTWNPDTGSDYIPFTDWDEENGGRLRSRNPDIFVDSCNIMFNKSRKSPIELEKFLGNLKLKDCIYWGNSADYGAILYSSVHGFVDFNETLIGWNLSWGEPETGYGDGGAFIFQTQKRLSGYVSEQMVTEFNDENLHRPHFVSQHITFTNTTITGNQCGRWLSILGDDAPYYDDYWGRIKYMQMFNSNSMGNTSETSYGGFPPSYISSINSIWYNNYGSMDLWLEEHNKKSQGDKGVLNENTAGVWGEFNCGTLNFDGVVGKDWVDKDVSGITPEALGTWDNYDDTLHHGLPNWSNNRFDTWLYDTLSLLPAGGNHNDEGSTDNFALGDSAGFYEFLDNQRGIDPQFIADAVATSVGDIESGTFQLRDMYALQIQSQCRGAGDVFAYGAAVGANGFCDLGYRQTDSAIFNFLLTNHHNETNLSTGSTFISLGSTNPEDRTVRIKTNYTPDIFGDPNLAPQGFSVDWGDGNTSSSDGDYASLVEFISDQLSHTYSTNDADTSFTVSVIYNAVSGSTFEGLTRQVIQQVSSPVPFEILGDNVQWFESDYAEYFEDLYMELPILSTPLPSYPALFYETHNKNLFFISNGVNSMGMGWGTQLEGGSGGQFGELADWDVVYTSEQSWGQSNYNKISCPGGWSWDYFTPADSAGSWSLADTFFPVYGTSITGNTQPNVFVQLVTNSGMGNSFPNNPSNPEPFGGGTQRPSVFRLIGPEAISNAGDSAFQEGVSYNISAVIGFPDSSVANIPDWETNSENFEMNLWELASRTQLASYTGQPRANELNPDHSTVIALGTSLDTGTRSSPVGWGITNNWGTIDYYKINLPNIELPPTFVGDSPLALQFRGTYQQFVIDCVSAERIIGGTEPQNCSWEMEIWDDRGTGDHDDFEHGPVNNVGPFTLDGSFDDITNDWGQCYFDLNWFYETYPEYWDKGFSGDIRARLFDAEGNEFVSDWKVNAIRFQSIDWAGRFRLTKVTASLDDHNMYPGDAAFDTHEGNWLWSRYFCIDSTGSDGHYSLHWDHTSELNPIPEYPGVDIYAHFIPRLNFAFNPVLGNLAQNWGQIEGNQIQGAYFTIPLGLNVANDGKYQFDLQADGGLINALSDPENITVMNPLQNPQFNSNVIDWAQNGIFSPIRSQSVQGYSTNNYYNDNWSINPGNFPSWGPDAVNNDWDYDVFFSIEPASNGTHMYAEEGDTTFFVQNHYDSLTLFQYKLQQHWEVHSIDTANAEAGGYIDINLRDSGLANLIEMAHPNDRYKSSDCHVEWHAYLWQENAAGNIQLLDVHDNWSDGYDVVTVAALDPVPNPGVSEYQMRMNLQPLFNGINPYSVHSCYIGVIATLNHNPDWDVENLNMSPDAPHRFHAGNSAMLLNTPSTNVFGYPTNLTYGFSKPFTISTGYDQGNIDGLFDNENPFIYVGGYLDTYDWSNKFIGWPFQLHSTSGQPTSQYILPIYSPFSDFPLESIEANIYYEFDEPLHFYEVQSDPYPNIGATSNNRIVSAMENINYLEQWYYGSGHPDNMSRWRQSAVRAYDTTVLSLASHNFGGLQSYLEVEGTFTLRVDLRDPSVPNNEFGGGLSFDPDAVQLQFPPGRYEGIKYLQIPQVISLPGIYFRSQELEGGLCQLDTDEYFTGTVPGRTHQFTALNFDSTQIQTTAQPLWLDSHYLEDQERKWEPAASGILTNGGMSPIQFAVTGATNVVTISLLDSSGDFVAVQGGPILDQEPLFGGDIQSAGNTLYRETIEGYWGRVGNDLSQFNIPPTDTPASWLPLYGDDIDTASPKFWYDWNIPDDTLINGDTYYLEISVNNSDVLASTYCKDEDRSNYFNTCTIGPLVAAQGPHISVDAPTEEQQDWYSNEGKSTVFAAKGITPGNHTLTQVELYKGGIGWANRLGTLIDTSIGTALDDTSYHNEFISVPALKPDYYHNEDFPFSKKYEPSSIQRMTDVFSQSQFSGVYKNPNLDGDTPVEDAFFDPWRDICWYLPMKGLQRRYSYGDTVGVVPGDWIDQMQTVVPNEEVDGIMYFKIPFYSLQQSSYSWSAFESWSIDYLTKTLVQNSMEFSYLAPTAGGDISITDSNSWFTYIETSPPGWLSTDRTWQYNYILDSTEVPNWPTRYILNLPGYQNYSGSTPKVYGLETIDYAEGQDPGIFFDSCDPDHINELTVMAWAYFDFPWGTTKSYQDSNSVNVAHTIMSRYIDANGFDMLEDGALALDEGFGSNPQGWYFGQPLGWDEFGFYQFMPTDDPTVWDSAKVTLPGVLKPSSYTGSNWFHFAATYNGPENRLRLYINGDLAAESVALNRMSVPGKNDISSIFPLECVGDITYGTRSARRAWKGILGEVKTFNRELAIDEIKYHRRYEGYPVTGGEDDFYLKYTTFQPYNYVDNDTVLVNALKGVSVPFTLRNRYVNFSNNYWGDSAQYVPTYLTNTSSIKGLGISNLIDNYDLGPYIQERIVDPQLGVSNIQQENLFKVLTKESTDYSFLWLPYAEGDYIGSTIYQNWNELFPNGLELPSYKLELLKWTKDASNVSGARWEGGTYEYIQDLTNTQWTTFITNFSTQPRTAGALKAFLENYCTPFGSSFINSNISNSSGFSEEQHFANNLLIGTDFSPNLESLQDTYAIRIISDFGEEHTDTSQLFTIESPQIYESSDAYTSKAIPNDNSFIYGVYAGDTHSIYWDNDANLGDCVNIYVVSVNSTWGRSGQALTLSTERIYTVTESANITGSGTSSRRKFDWEVPTQSVFDERWTWPKSYDTPLQYYNSGSVKCYGIIIEQCGQDSSAVLQSHLVPGDSTSNLTTKTLQGYGAIAQNQSWVDSIQDSINAGYVEDVETWNDLLYVFGRGMFFQYFKAAPFTTTQFINSNYTPANANEGVDTNAFVYTNPSAAMRFRQRQNAIFATGGTGPGGDIGLPGQTGYRERDKGYYSSYDLDLYKDSLYVTRIASDLNYNFYHDQMENPYLYIDFSQVEAISQDSNYQIKVIPHYHQPQSFVYGPVANSDHVEIWSDTFSLVEPSFIQPQLPMLGDTLWYTGSTQVRWLNNLPWSGDTAIQIELWKSVGNEATIYETLLFNGAQNEGNGLYAWTLPDSANLNGVLDPGWYKVKLLSGVVEEFTDEFYIAGAIPNHEVSVVNPSIADRYIIGQDDFIDVLWSSTFGDTNVNIRLHYTVDDYTIDGSVVNPILTTEFLNQTNDGYFEIGLTDFPYGTASGVAPYMSLESHKVSIEEYGNPSIVDTGAVFMINTEAAITLLNDAHGIPFKTEYYSGDTIYIDWRETGGFPDSSIEFVDASGNSILTIFEEANTFNSITDTYSANFRVPSSISQDFNGGDIHIRVNQLGMPGLEPYASYADSPPMRLWETPAIEWISPLYQELSVQEDTIRPQIYHNQVVTLEFSHRNFGVSPATGTLGDTVEVQLWNEGAFHETIRDDFVITPLSEVERFLWQVSDTLAASDTYQIRIHSTGDTTISVTSPNMYVGQEPSLNITSPVSDDIWVEGDTANITLSCTGASDILASINHPGGMDYYEVFTGQATYDTTINQWVIDTTINITIPNVAESSNFYQVEVYRQFPETWEEVDFVDRKDYDNYNWVPNVRIGNGGYIDVEFPGINQEMYLGSSYSFEWITYDMNMWLEADATIAIDIELYNPDTTQSSYITKIAENQGMDWINTSGSSGWDYDNQREVPDFSGTLQLRGSYVWNIPVYDPAITAGTDYFVRFRLSDQSHQYITNWEFDIWPQTEWDLYGSGTIEIDTANRQLESTGENTAAVNIAAWATEAANTVYALRYNVTYGAGSPVITAKGPFTDLTLASESGAYTQYLELDGSGDDTLFLDFGPGATSYVEVDQFSVRKGPISDAPDQIVNIDLLNPATLEVTYPTTSPNFIFGTSETITWGSTLSPNLVRLDLYRDNQFFDTISIGTLSGTNQDSANISSDTFEWAIPSIPTQGAGGSWYGEGYSYSIRVSDANDPNISAFSPYFSIGYNTEVILLAPGGEDSDEPIEWFAMEGDTLDITWLAHHCPQTDILIYNIPATEYGSSEFNNNWNDTSLYNLVSTVAVMHPTPDSDSTQLIQFGIPTDYNSTNGENSGVGYYKVVLRKTGSSDIFDWGATFRIFNNPQITVTQPTSGSDWRRGTQHLISWSPEFSYGEYVKIVLYYGGAPMYDIAEEINVNFGEFNWEIPNEVPIGNLYQIGIKYIDLPDFINEDITFFSTNFEISTDGDIGEGLIRINPIDAMKGD